jgi:hypothetical protein
MESIHSSSLRGTWGCENMKKILLYAAILGAAAGVYFLYGKQLGAIAFFLLAIYFAWLAYKKWDRPMRRRKRGRAD